MTLDEFVAQARRTIDLMESEWRKWHQEMPSTWPMDMADGDWWEHFLSTDWEEVSEE